MGVVVVPTVYIYIYINKSSYARMDHAYLGKVRILYVYIYIYIG